MFMILYVRTYASFVLKFTGRLLYWIYPEMIGYILRKKKSPEKAY